MDLPEDIFQQYARTVYKYLLTRTRSPDLAEELTQETFYQAIRSSARFDGSSSVMTWLCAIAKRVHLAYLRKHPKLEDIDAIDLADGAADEKTLGAESRLSLMKALHGLPEPMRETVYLRALGGFSFREIGGILGMSENAARVTYFRGRQKLRKELEDDE
ncbi:MAG: sigma-70 family RNA polymerase sigma factor [Clostridia bacterium]|nr:sigma-70 family RNA polymerase sigma factor [Clostridia bacterium]